MKKPLYSPKTIWGKELPLNDKAKRKRYYLIESALFALFMTIINVAVFLYKGLIDTIIISANNTLNVIFTIIFSILLSFVIAFLLNFLLSEHAVKKYNSKIK